jgi:hypothetical protein
MKCLVANLRVIKFRRVNRRRMNFYSEAVEFSTRLRGGDYSLLLPNHRREAFFSEMTSYRRLDAIRNVLILDTGYNF